MGLFDEVLKPGAKSPSAEQDELTQMRNEMAAMRLKSEVARRFGGGLSKEAEQLYIERILDEEREAVQKVQQKKQFEQRKIEMAEKRKQTIATFHTRKNLKVYNTTTDETGTHHKEMLGTSVGYRCIACSEPLAMVNTYLADFVEHDDDSPKYNLGLVCFSRQKSWVKCPCGQSHSITIMQVG